MSWFELAVLIGLFVAAPLSMAAWIAVGAPGSRIYWALKVAAAAALLLVLWQAPGWHIVGIYSRWIELGALAFAVVWSARKVGELPWWTGGLWPTGVAAAVLAVVTAYSSYQAVQWLSGRGLPDEEPVALQFPLDGGTYFVVGGGSSPVANRHMKVLEDPEFRDYRGQAYALDVVQVNAFGFRASGLYPGDRKAYAIFGTPVNAPCSGRVVDIENELPDFDPPGKDPDRKPGNYVFLACGEARVLLAHLQKGSIEVSSGEEVESGQIVGRVGNSGNTSEPHLHVHAQRPADDGSFLSGDPLPMTFEDRSYSSATVVGR